MAVCQPLARCLPRIINPAVAGGIRAGKNYVTRNSYAKSSNIVTASLIRLVIGRLLVHVFGAPFLFQDASPLESVSCRKISWL
jgi:hypothetical protein